MNLSIEQTALVCVYLSSVENKERRPLYKDEKADEIVEKLEKSHLKLDINQDKFWLNPNYYGMLASRFRNIFPIRNHWSDLKINQFLEKYGQESPLIVEFGCGLDTRFYRMNFEKRGVKHLLIDLPTIVDLRKKHFNETEDITSNPRLLAISACDIEDWSMKIEEMCVKSNGKSQPILFVGLAIFFFLDADKVKKIFKFISETYTQNHSHCELIIDTISQHVIARGELLNEATNGMKWTLQPEENPFKEIYENDQNVSIKNYDTKNVFKACRDLYEERMTAENFKKWEESIGQEFLDYEGYDLHHLVFERT